MLKSNILSTNSFKLILMFFLAIALGIGFQFIDVNLNYFEFSMSIRTPKLITMIIASFCIGTASIVFQSVIANRIVTPCLLGMNGLYILIHTALAFVFGATSVIFSNKNLTFMIDVALMGVFGTIIYGFLFKKTKSNILYVLLAGSVMATLFTSISSTLTRIMDPNEYDVLLTTLVAGFDHVNAEIIVLATILIVVIILALKKDLEVLDVLTLGKNQAINLGVDYDKTITRLLVGIVLFITIATALVGPISFLGLIIANISRELFKTYKHTYLMIGSFLSGMIVLFLGQILIEHVFNFGVVISVFINLFGGIYFLYLILRNKGEA